MKKNNKEETLKKWEELLDKMGLNDVSTTKIDIARILDSDASKLLKEDMNKERFNQIIDEVYNKYLTKYVGYDDVPSKKLFLYEIKNNTEFSERWGLKIEEKKLRNVERQILLEQKGSVYQGVLASKAKNYKSHKKIIESIKETCDEFNIPTKLITLEYNGTKIEVYE